MLYEVAPHLGLPHQRGADFPVVPRRHPARLAHEFCQRVVRPHRADHYLRRKVALRGCDGDTAVEVEAAGAGAGEDFRAGVTRRLEQRVVENFAPNVPRCMGAKIKFDATVACYDILRLMGVA